MKQPEPEAPSSNADARHPKGERLLGFRAYGSTPHLPGSRMGPADHALHEGEARRCLSRARHPRDEVLVQEKLDGSCVAAARVGAEVLALGRGGRLAEQSEFPVRRAWARWVAQQQERLLAVLEPGERLVGEWLALAHATRYALAHEPLVVFDLLRGPSTRLPYDQLCARVHPAGFVTPALVHRGAPLAIAEALERLGPLGRHGALDLVEGAVWRVERAPLAGPRSVQLVCKYVRPEKVDGALLPEATGGAPLWNWWFQGEETPGDRVSAP